MCNWIRPCAAGCAAGSWLELGGNLESDWRLRVLDHCNPRSHLMCVTLLILLHAQLEFLLLCCLIFLLTCYSHCNNRYCVQSAGTRVHGRLASEEAMPPLYLSYLLSLFASLQGNSFLACTLLIYVIMCVRRAARRTAALAVQLYCGRHP